MNLLWGLKIKLLKIYFIKIAAKNELKGKLANYKHDYNPLLMNLNAVYFSKVCVLTCSVCECSAAALSALSEWRPSVCVDGFPLRSSVMGWKAAVGTSS